MNTISRLARSALRPPIRSRSDEARRQRARRFALLLALYGIDIGPRIIHGREVTA
ncbi:hypothetical protein [Streptomyces candidus]|uniref:Uncharacterized protein n=1 Tax=Streptomyces candidus TaxID=67283 RepID=A0A7X0LRJ9_9ACTN|nr:hypothetical protein [Streptomyces candidus]MBB6437041.1 hypothetical protein [Streptomyces candidus]GHH32739.1 hypothetical protein GCM10018773_02250 [Streptomyces candidus]